MFKRQKAQREQVKLKIGLTGPSGSGKTYSALQLAYGLCGDWSKVTVADTENRSSLYYAGEKTGAWEYIDFPSSIQGGYHPKNWCKLIDYVESTDTEVLILDSISHEWQGIGGCMELCDKINKGFASWKTVTPLHNSFIDKIRQSSVHVIATMRSVQDYVVEKNDKGKSSPRKVGLKSNQREGTDYEFGLILDINMEHLASSSKDRTGLFFEETPFLITPDTGKMLMGWSKQGKDKNDISYDQNNLNHKAVLKKEFEKHNVEEVKLMTEISIQAAACEVPLKNLGVFVYEYLSGDKLENVDETTK